MNVNMRVMSVWNASTSRSDMIPTCSVNVAGAPAAGTYGQGFEIAPGEAFTPYYSLLHGIKMYAHI